MVLTGMLQLGPRATAEVASNMTSVERVLQYSKLEKEGPFESLPAHKPPRDWPQKGKITFKNTYLRYDPDAAPALRNLNVTINPTEKVNLLLNPLVLYLKVTCYQLLESKCHKTVTDP